MCDLIARYIQDSTGNEIDPRVLWVSVPGGELSYIFSAYMQARAYYGMYTADALPAQAVVGDVAIVPDANAANTSRVCMFVGGQWLTMSTVRHHESASS